MSRSAPITVMRAIQKTVEQLRDQHFKESSIDGYLWIWKKFVIYASKRGRRYFSTSLANEYLIAATAPLHRLRPSARQAIHRAMRVIQEHVATGRHRNMPPRKTCANLPLFMAKELSIFSEYISKELAWSHSTIRNRVADTRCFLAYSHRQGMKDWVAITPHRIMSYLGTLAAHAVNTRVATINAIRAFCRFLFIRGLLVNAVHKGLPSIKQDRGRRLIEPWTIQELRQVLDVVDRHSPVGKRDYLVLLLAARLGMRVGDIRRLCLENIHWDQSFIEFVQQKTKQNLRLPFSDEVGNALADYLQHARILTDRREIILSQHAPHGPLGRHNNLHGIPSLLRKKAGLPPRAWCGLHSLRHTLATHLLEGGAKIESVAGFLGHRSLDTTMLYLRVDLTALRQAGLDPDQEVRHV